MTKYNLLIKTGALFLFFLIITGCASTAPTRFYSLSSLAASDAANETSSDNNEIAIEVKPVEIPDYLSRPHIITRAGQNEITVADFDKWAGSLKTDITRVIAENLSVLFSSSHIYASPRESYIPVKYQIMVNVSRFDGTLGGDVVLKAQWIILEGEDRTIIVMDRAKFSEKTEGKDYASLVAAKSRMIEKLSREIAASITRE